MQTNLPEQFTPFVGRRREVAEVRRLLTVSRVVTLTGPGGVGKTRLALAVAANLQRAFPDGVWFLGLDGIEEQSLLAPHVCDVLAFQPQANVGNLAQFLKSKHLLLVLDNCEHLIDAVAQLAEEIARCCPNVRILATSRTPLRAAGDVTFQVQPLSMPTSAPTEDQQAVDASDAVRFFVNRAQVAAPGFELSAENRADVYGLVRRLDRLPLALELAAVRLRSLTVRQIGERIENHRTMLDWGSRSAPVRQQTMRSSLQYSWDLCTAGEQRLWSRLSVFRGTFDLDAVVTVCSDPPPADDILDLVHGLVERSIVVREDHGEFTRYSMLEMIREFGRAQLDTTQGEFALLRARHMTYYFGLISRAAAQWNSDNQVRWLRHLPLEHRNILVALSAALDSPDDVDAAAEAVLGLWRYYWWASGSQSEGVYWAQRYADRATTPATRARVSVLGSQLALVNGDDQAARALLDVGRLLAHEVADPRSCAMVEHVQGNAALYAGQYPRAVDHFHRALTIFDDRSTSDRVDSLLILTLACAGKGDIEAAEAAHRQVLSVLDEGEKFQRSYAFLYFGEALRRGGLVDRAQSAVRESVRLKSTFDDLFGIAWSFEVFAKIARARGQYERAAFLRGAASRLWRVLRIDATTLLRLDIWDGPGEVEATRNTLLHSETRRGEQASLEAAIAVAMEERPSRATSQSAPDVLTLRESQVADLVAQGMTNKEIAVKLLIARRTVDAHVQNILNKLGFNVRAQVATWVTSSHR